MNEDNPKDVEKHIDVYYHPDDGSCDIKITIICDYKIEKNKLFNFTEAHHLQDIMLEVKELENEI